MHGMGRAVGLALGKCWRPTVNTEDPHGASGVGKESPKYEVRRGGIAQRVARSRLRKSRAWDHHSRLRPINQSRWHRVWSTSKLSEADSGHDWRRPPLAIRDDQRGRSLYELSALTPGMSTQGGALTNQHGPHDSTRQALGLNLEQHPRSWVSIQERGELKGRFTSRPCGSLGAGRASGPPSVHPKLGTPMARSRTRLRFLRLRLPRGSHCSRFRSGSRHRADTAQIDFLDKFGVGQNIIEHVNELGGLHKHAHTPNTSVKRSWTMTSRL